MVTELLMLVKTTNVLSILKTLGELTTVHPDIQNSIVIVHLKLSITLVMVLGIVMISSPSLLIS